MQAGKKYSLWQTVRWSGGFLLIFLAIDSIPVALYYFFDFKWLVIPWQPISLVGIAVAFYLGFKNNSSYERLWEGRKIWGGIVNASRTFTVSSRDFVTNDFASQKLSEDELNAVRRTIVYRHVAWLKALTFQLREKRAWEHDRANDEWFRNEAGIHPDQDHFPKIKPYLSDEEYAYVMSKGNKASHLLSLQSKHFMRLKTLGLLDDFRHMELESLIGELYTLQGKSERIKNFPFPRQYATVNYFFVWIFNILLPFAMLGIFANAADRNFIWLCIPFTVLVSWVFQMMEMIGEYSENPFEGLYNDVPITAMANDIEIDIRQMIEDTDLPDKMQPITPFKILY